ncbi:3-oxoacid CoA-transferase subunit B [Bacillus kexueae]|uniref:3-oxoacid CoA-transferase subunit B n=1 Tax=Aeribacillus kexueae TaxID=2078952 RepID=UPI001FAF11CF
MGMGNEIRNRMAKRAAKEIQHGMIVNLGIGIPSLIPNYIPKDRHVMIHAENGLLGIGPYPKSGEEDAYLCDAAGIPVTIQDGGSYFDSSMAFAIIRRGKIDLSIIGSLQVSEQGDLANWIVPGKRVPGIGGAMDLAQKARKLIVVMNFANKNGESKIVPKCTLPLTAEKCVDMIITERAVFERKENRLVLTEVFYPYSISEIVNALLPINLAVSEKVKLVHIE